MTMPGRTESKQAKSQPIEKRQVWEAWKHVRQGGKAVGVDELTIQEIDRDPGRYLYPLWNRLASGSYMPPPVREKSIPKGDGTERAQNGESGHPSRLKAASLAGGIGAFGFQCNQVAGLIRFWPLLDSPLRPIRWQLSRSLSQMASAAPASPMTFPHFSMGT